MLQLDPESRKNLSANIRNRIDAAAQHVTNISFDISDVNIKPAAKAKGEKDIKYLQQRIAEFQITYRLIFNTNWLIEKRAEFLNVLKSRVETYTRNKEGVLKLRAEQQIKELEKAMKCNKCRVIDEVPGYKGFNTSTGEFNLCQCTKNTLHIVK
jgi:hypothetical protein